MSPRTQSAMAIHACRSINVARRAIHRRGGLTVGASSHVWAEPGRVLVRPTGDIGPTGAHPARFRAELRASPLLPKNRRNTLVRSGIPRPVRRGTTAQAKATVGTRE